MTDGPKGEDNVRALITGAASGIGRATAERLARDGVARGGATTIVVAASHHTALCHSV